MSRRMHKINKYTNELLIHNTMQIKNEHDLTCI